MSWLVETNSAQPVVPSRSPVDMLIDELATKSGIPDTRTLALLNGTPTDKLMAGLIKKNAAVVDYILKDLSAQDFMSGLSNSSGRMPLNFVVTHGDLEMVEVFINAARSLSTPADSSSSANDDGSCCNVVQAFVRQCDMVEKTSALHEAVRMGNMAAAEVLVKADQDHRHAQNYDGETPIYIAAKLGHMDILKMMCAILTVPAIEGPDDTTAFHAAIARLPKACVLLQASHFNCSKYGTMEGSDAVQVLIEALMRYRGDQNEQVMKTLVCKADDKCGNTALHLAVLGKHLGVVRQLLDQDKMPFSHDLENNFDSKNPPYIAAELGYTDVFKEFCTPKYSFSIMTRGPRRQTVLHAAISSRDADCVRYVSEYMVVHDIQIFCDVEGRSPLWLAMEVGYISAVIQLVILLPDLCLEIYQNDKRNILHFAAFQGDYAMVHAILNYISPHCIDILVKGKDVDGNTPLHLLVQSGCFVPELIEYEGIEKMVKNNKNLTPRDMLYIHDNIVADQLKIKEALDGAHWRRSSNFESITQESSVPPWIRSEKDAKFKRANKILMKPALERYKEGTNTQIIVTTLIVTVTFTVGFTMPGGYFQSGEQNQGLALLSKKNAFNAFVISDALALALSTTSLFLYFISTLYEDPSQVTKLGVISVVLNSISIIAMMLTFITGTYAVLSHSPVVAITVCIICSTFFLSIIAVMAKIRSDRQ